MKKTAFIIMLLISTAIVSNAQQQRQRLSPEERAQKQVELLRQKLNLTPEQKTKVTAIFNAQAKSIDSLRKASNGDREAMKGKVKPIMDSTEKELQAVLTEEQKKAYKTLKAEQRSRMEQGRKRQENQ